MKLLKKTSERRESVGFLGRFKTLLLLMLLCMLIIPVQQAQAAHTYDKTARNIAATNPRTRTFTCVNGATLLVLGIVTAGATARTGGAPTYNGATMTQVNSTRIATETNVEMWYLANPSTGASYTISVPNSGLLTVSLIASSYIAASGYTSTLDVSNGNTGTTLNPSVSVTTTVNGDAVVDILGDGLDTAPTARNRTLLSSTDEGTYSANAQYALQATFGAIAFTWTVAAEDWAMVVGAFKEVALPPAPVATDATAVQSTSFSANWGASTGATGYRLDVSTDSGFTSFVTGYNNLDVGNVLTYSVSSNISANTTYYYRVRAYNAYGPSGNSNYITLTTPLPANLDQIHYRWRNDDGGEGGIAFATASNGTTTGGSSITISSYTVSGVNRLMLVGVSMCVDLNETVSSVTWKGTETLTRVGQIANGNDARVEIWSLVAPSTGTDNVVVTFSAALSQQAVAGVATFTGVDQTTPLGTFASATGNNSSPATVNVSSTSGELVLGVVGTEYEAVTPAAGQTDRWNRFITGSGGTGAAGSTKAGAGPTVTMSWTLDPTYVHWAVGGISIKPASGTGATFMANQDTGITELAKSATVRVRFEVSNEGGFTSGGVTYQLQVSQTSTCSSGTYAAVPTDASGQWQIVNSTYITDGEATSNIAGGLTDESATFINGQLKDAGNTTGSITLNGNEFTENEFAVQATTNAVDGDHYCFRLYNMAGGAPLNTYSQYAEATLACFTAAPVATAATNIQATSFSANWNALAGATEYYLDVATDSGFTSFVQGYQDLYVGDVLTYSVANWPISPATTYYYRVRGYKACGTSANSNTISVTTLDGLMLGNHTLWQVTNKFTTTSPVTDVLFRFNLSRGGTVTVDNLRVNFTTAGGVADGDVTNGELWEDVDNDGVIDSPGDTLIQGSVAGSGGVLLFTSNFIPSTSGTNYLVRATVANLIVGDTTTFSVGTADIDVLPGGVAKLYSISDATHSRIGVSSLYRSVGTNANDLNTGGRTVTISGTTATFSGSMPNNVGVGDVLQYPASAPFYIAFIHGRISDTVYTVKTVSGATPQPAAADTSVNVYRAYTSLSNWQAQSENTSIDATVRNFDTSKNLVSADAVMNVACYADGDDTTRVEIDGWTTGANNYINIYTPYLPSEVGARQRHMGTWASGGYKLVAAYEWYGVFYIRDEYVRVTGLRIENTAVKGNRPAGVDINIGSSEVRVSHNIIRATGTGTGDWFCAGILQRNVGGVLKAWNNIIYDWGDGVYQEYTSGSSSVTLYNNTIVNSTDAGINIGNHGSGTYRLANNLVQGPPGYNYYYPSVTLAYSSTNLSQDGTAPAAAGGGGAPLRNKTVLFVGAADFHLASSDTNAKDQGTSLSSDANLPFSVDIEGESRPFGSAWDIGADEYVTGLFAYRRQITFGDAMTPASCTSDLSNFPVLVKVTDANLKSASNGGHVESASGYDIIFRALDGTTQLDHEIETYVPTTGELIAWVRIPTLVYNADTTIYMYYGNAGITSPTANPAGVWSNGYLGVWHLKESGNGTADEYDDSSPYANEGQGGRGNSLYVPHQTAGQIGYGQDFNNSDGKYDLVDVGNKNSVLDVSGNQITLEAWVKHNVTPPGHLNYGIVNHKGYYSGYRLLMRADTYGCAQPLCIHFDLGEQEKRLGTATVLTAGMWHHVVGTYDGSLMRVFFDGVQDDNTLAKTAALTAPPPPEDHVWIGHGDQPTDVDWSSEWEGQIDEVRISNVARSTCWIGTEYNNQGTPTNVNLGGEQVVDSTYAYHQPITIANAMTPGSCTGNLANFPVLIDTTSWATEAKNALRTVANLGHVQSTNGYDIIFRDTSDLQLDHEIESYNATNGTLVAWVRIPSLNPSGDTTIYMYYGNSAITSPTANPTGVWDASYKGVWHLSNNSFLDSTSNANNGTNYNTTDIGGKMGNARYFDGAIVPPNNHYIGVPNNSGLTLTSEMTLEAWVYLANPSTNQKIVGRTNNGTLLGYELGTGDVQTGMYPEVWDTSGSGIPYTFKSGSISANTWAHEVVSWKTGGNMIGYINGSQVNSIPASALNIGAGTRDLVIGAAAWDPTVWRLTGRIDEVRVSSKARDACWIETSYNNQNSPGTTVTPGAEQVDPSTYDYQQSITIANAMTPGSCTGDLTNFPVLIDTTNWAATYKDPLKTVANAGHVQNTNGYDIIFRDTGDVQLDHEIESYDGSTGTLLAWVRIPTLVYNADTTIFMYYGNSAITSPTANPTRVWDTNYKGVWHLSNNSFEDSTSNNNDGTNYNTTDIGGKIANARNFNEASQYITTPSTDLKTANSFTVSTWFKASDTAYAHHLLWEGIAAGGNGWGETGSYVQEMNLSMGNYLGSTGYSNYLSFFLGDRDVGSESGAIQISTAFSDTTNWHHAVATVTNLDTPTPSGILYYDGTSVGTVTGTSVRTGRDTWDTSLQMGKPGTATRYYGGNLDEVRIATVARNACWIGTEYNNQSSPGTYVTPGGEDTEPAVYTSQRTITIRDAMTPASCSTDLSNFPILIDTTNWPAADKDTLKTVANGGNVENSNGYDIIFRDASDLKLDHEIEKYDGATGTLVAWVKIPTLAYNGNTIITMHYGNSGITAPTQNAPGVWSNGFREVWHLKETGGGTVADSTASAYTGTASAGVNQNPATEKIDGADGFNGSTGVTILNDGTITSNSPLTLESWFYLTTPPVDGAYLPFPSKQRDYSGTQDWVGLYAAYDSGGPWGRPYPALIFGWGNTGGNLLGTTQLAGGQWYYAAGTYDYAASQSRRLYLNGILESSDTGVASYSTNLTNPSHIGNDGENSYYLNGFADEVRISSVARDECWIGTSYNTVQYASDTNYITPGSEIGLAPTAVELSSLTATAYADGQVLISWKTGYEVNNLGFHVYREEKGQLVRLTPEPVAGSALLAGSRIALRAGRHYSWWDFPTLSPQSSALSPVRYWLKDIDLSGKETMHGPVTPVISKEPLPNKFRPELLSELGMKLEERYHHYWKVQDLRERLRLRNRGRHKLFVKTNNDSRITYNKRTSRSSRPEADLLTQQYLASRPAIKLLVREEGWYQVSQPELVAAGLSPSVDPRYLHLFAEGREQLIRVIGGKNGRFGPQDAIEFYGVGLDTPSTDTRVYWLVESSKPGKRIHEYKSHGGRIFAGSFPHTVQVKDRWIYLPAIKNGEEENFFGGVVYGSGVDQLLGVRHIDLASSEDALLEVALQGATNTPHRVKVLVNDEEVGEVVFEGQSKGLLQVEVPQALLHEGDNLVSLVPQGGEMDISLVDTIRLTYWHTYTADDNGLRLRARGGSEVSIDGFSQSDIRVFDITDSNEVIEVIGRVAFQKESYAVSLRVPGHGERTLLALSEDRVKSPVEIVSDHPSAWHQEKGGYGLLIISHREFFSSLQPLIRLRESQGYRVALIDVEDIYDEFSFGNKSPYALRDFLSLAKKQWSKPPRFVLLVGDASFDPRNYLGSGDLDFVPTKLIDTAYLETASDDWFVDLNSDGLPEMAIGRLPVQTAKEAATVVSKIVGYERSSKKREAILVSDINDGFNFEGASEEIGGLLPSSLMVRKIYRGQFSSNDQVRGVLLGSIKEGALLVNFIGHGSIEEWRGIFTSEDAENLLNKGLPFFVNMTCLNGYFQDPYSETMAESLLKAQSGGAVAIWASSGLTEPDQQAVMNKELIKLLFGRESLTLGEATARAKGSVSDQDIRKTWILFGDPTTRLRP